MGTNRYWCENSFGAIYHRLCWGWDIVKTKFCYQRLWLKNSHFSSFFSFFGLMAVATTVMPTLGIGCTQRLVRHMGWWYGTIFDHPGHISMTWGGQKWLIFRSKLGNNGRPVPGQGTNLETILCAISPPNTWGSMTLDHLTTPAIYPMDIIHGWRGSKMESRLEWPRNTWQFIC